MLLAAVPLGMMLPGSFVALPMETYSVTRALAGGLLVGIGSSMGNGCTSGHGICGQARLSLRSLAYTLSFMGVGAVTATLLGSAAATRGPMAGVPALLQLPSAEFMSLALGLAGSASALLIGLGLMGRRSPASLLPVLESVSTVGIGATFAAGLAISGMILPSKVTGFLSPASVAWDPTLAFVMASALMVALIAYQSVLGRFPLLPSSLTIKANGKPLLTSAYNMPAPSSVDTKLLAGAVVFGAGWGLCGICPGPALVGFAGSLAEWASSGGAVLSNHLCYHTGLYIAAMAVGFWLELRLSRAFVRRFSSAASSKKVLAAPSSKKELL